MSGKVIEISGDLFACPETSSMAHCVTANMGMGKGIAVKFKNKFGQIPHLKSQNVETGGVAILKDNNRYIYYLVTKKLSSNKPTYQNLQSSLSAMRDHMLKNNVKELAIPRIGCGIDGLDWVKVKGILEEVFNNDDLQITVYNYIP